MASCLQITCVPPLGFCLVATLQGLSRTNKKQYLVIKVQLAFKSVPLTVPEIQFGTVEVSRWVTTRSVNQATQIFTKTS